MWRKLAQQWNGRHSQNEVRKRSLTDASNTGIHTARTRPEKNPSQCHHIQRKDCPAKGATCYWCIKIGYHSKVCHSKKEKMHGVQVEQSTSLFEKCMKSEEAAFFQGGVANMKASKLVKLPVAHINVVSHVVESNQPNQTFAWWFNPTYFVPAPLWSCTSTQLHVYKNTHSTVMYGCSGQHYSGSVQLAEPFCIVHQERRANLSCL